MNQPVKWYEIKALASDDARSAEVYVYGNIGDRWDENGVIAADFVRAIDAGTSYAVIPWQMGVVAKLLRMLPNAVFDRAFAGAKRKPRRGELGL